MECCIYPCLLHHRGRISEARALGIWSDVDVRSERHILYDTYQFRGAAMSCWRPVPDPGSYHTYRRHKVADAGFLPHVKCAI